MASDPYAALETKTHARRHNLYILAYRTLLIINGHVASDLPQPWFTPGEPGEAWWDLWLQAIDQVNAKIDAVSADVRVPADRQVEPTARLTARISTILLPLAPSTTNGHAWVERAFGENLFLEELLFHCAACGVQVDRDRNRCYVHCGHEGDNVGSTCMYCNLCGLSW